MAKRGEITLQSLVPVQGALSSGEHGAVWQRAVSLVVGHLPGGDKDPRSLVQIQLFPPFCRGLIGRTLAFGAGWSRFESWRQILCLLVCMERTPDTGSGGSGSIPVQASILSSSNGRTTDSESVNRCSNHWERASRVRSRRMAGQRRRQETARGDGRRISQTPRVLRLILASHASCVPVVKRQRHHLQNVEFAGSTPARDTQGEGVKCDRPTIRPLRTMDSPR